MQRPSVADDPRPQEVGRRVHPPYVVNQEVVAVEFGVEPRIVMRQGLLQIEDRRPFDFREPTNE